MSPTTTYPWNWLNLGTPPAANGAAITPTQQIGTVTAQEGVNVLAVYSDHNMWNCYGYVPTDPATNSDPVSWTWHNLGQPTYEADHQTKPVNITSPMGHLAEGATVLVAVLGEDGNLWICISQARTASTWQWHNVGKPAGVELGTSMGALSIGSRPHFLVLGSDNNLWACHLDASSNPNSKWNWTNLEQPPATTTKATLTTRVGDVVVGGSQPNVLALDTNNNLWTCWQSAK